MKALNLRESTESPLTDYWVWLKKLHSRSQNGSALDRFCVLLRL